MDDVLHSLSKGKIFSLFDLVSSFHDVIEQKDAILPIAFCRATKLYKRLAMPQGSGAAPGWFIIVINEVFKGSRNATVYLDDIMVFNDIPNSHVLSIHDFSSDDGNTTSNCRQRSHSWVRWKTISLAIPSLPST